MRSKPDWFARRHDPARLNQCQLMTIDPQSLGADEVAFIQWLNHGLALASLEVRATPKQQSGGLRRESR